jgi:hypothetical protein
MAKDTAPRVSLHRFRDCGALSVLNNPDGGSVYLDKRAARQLARDLARLARSLEREAFTASAYRMESIPARRRPGQEV